MTGVDVGDTFTDIVLVDPDGITVTKVSSNPPDIQDGSLEALRKACIGGSTGKAPLNSSRSAWNERP